jgi:putative transposase
VRGFNSAKQVKGRKRHLSAETPGLVLKVVVTEAGTQDRKGAGRRLVMILELFPRLFTVWAAGSHRGSMLA